MQHLLFDNLKQISVDSIYLFSKRGKKNTYKHIYWTEKIKHNIQNKISFIMILCILLHSGVLKFSWKS